MDISTEFRVFQSWIYEFEDLRISPKLGRLSGVYDMHSFRGTKETQIWNPLETQIATSSPIK